MFKLVDLQQCQKEIQSICDLTAITLGERGSLIISKNNEEFIEPQTFGKVIDTTGAGDIYAGGFIHGLINNFSLKDCGNLGSICAGHIVTQIGSRSDIKLKDLIRDYLT